MDQRRRDRMLAAERAKEAYQWSRERAALAKDEAARAAAESAELQSSLSNLTALDIASCAERFVAGVTFTEIADTAGIVPAHAGLFRDRLEEFVIDALVPSDDDGSIRRKIEAMEMKKALRLAVLMTK